MEVVSEKMLNSPLPSGPPPQPVWKSPRLPGRSPLKQEFSLPASAVVPWSWEATPGLTSSPKLSSASIGTWPIQCFWKDWTLPGSTSESAYCCAAVSHHVPSNCLWSLRARFFAHANVRQSCLERAMSARSYSERM
jgi:hypothetical protein